MDKECFDRKVKEQYFKKLETCAGKSPFIYDILYEKCFGDMKPLGSFGV